MQLKSTYKKTTKEKDQKQEERIESNPQKLADCEEENARKAVEREHTARLKEERASKRALV